MTTPSETRAGKLPENFSESELKDIAYALRSYVTKTGTKLHAGPFRSARVLEWANRLEALAASEPDMRDAYEGAREDLLDWKGRAQRAEARLRALGWTGIDASERPAPEQPDKGELAIAIKALRKIATEQSAVTPTEAADLFQRLARDALTDIGTSRIFTGAPQPRKGEAYRAPASPEAMRENQSQPTFMREPQPSDPAEGDAPSWSDWMASLQNNLLDALINDPDNMKAHVTTAFDKVAALAAAPQPSDPADGLPWGWKIVVKGEHVRVTKPDGSVSEWQKRPETNGSGMYDLCIALSTPPTAAVSVDMDDLLFVGFDANSEHRLFRMRKTAERHCIGEIKTYAALDPQVKR